MFQNVIIRLSQLVPLSLRSGLASSSYGNFVRSILNRMSKDPLPIARLCGPLAGRRMRVNWALHKTYVFGTHEPQVMQTIKDLVQPGWTAIDVGAHIGYSTLLLATCVGPKGRVIAFEPLTENFKLLQENARLNSYSNIFAENLAVMGQSGQIELRSATPGAMTWVASTSVDQATAVESRIVEGITLDEYAERKRIERIDFVKMDVEGAEASALSGMTSVLGRDKPMLVIEIHQYDRYGESHPALCKLREYSYKITDLGMRNWERHVLATAGHQLPSRVETAPSS